MSSVVPKLIVFDLDFTLWSAGGLWIDCTSWPFSERDGKIFDAEEREFKLYPDIEPIIRQLQDEGCMLGIASRTSEPGWARWVLDIWELREQFDFEEIYPGSKITHFEALRDKSEVDYADMLFFDDENRNIREVGELGVCSIHVEDTGVTRSKFEHGLNLWRKSKN